MQTLTLNCLWPTAEAVRAVTGDQSIRRNGRQKMADRLRIGVVGTSWWTETFHLAGIASHGKADLVAICGQNHDRAGAVADRHGQPRVFTDYRTMIASGLLDAVVVATPDDSHHDITMAALESGLHVLCEKPLARSAEDARQMLNAAEAAGVVHMVMFTWRWLGIFTYVKQLLASGYIGRCRDARFIMQADYAMDPDYFWRFDPARGSGILGDSGSHMIDLARWYLGDVVQVGAQLVTHIPRPGPDGGTARSLDDTAMLLLEFATGARATVDLSAVRMVGEIPTQRISLYGDEGSLEADAQGGSARLRGRRRADTSWEDLPIPAGLLGLDGRPPILDVPLLAPLTNLPVGDRLFVDAALGNAQAEPTFEDGWQTQRVVDAAITANRERCWVPVV